MIRFIVHRPWLAALFAILVALGLAQVALAQQSTPLPVSDDQVNAVAKQLYCPVCENTPLDVCPTTACAQWRDQIRQQLSQGWTEQQIKDYFVQQYGDRVLAAPPARGLNWLVYIIPPLAIIAGAAILYRAMQAWKRPAVQPDTTIPASDQPADPYISRLEEQLRASEKK